MAKKTYTVILTPRDSHDDIKIIVRTDQELKEIQLDTSGEQQNETLAKSNPVKADELQKKGEELLDRLDNELKDEEDKLGKSNKKDTKKERWERVKFWTSQGVTILSKVLDFFFKGL